MIEGNKIGKEKSEAEYRAIEMLSSSDLRLFNTDRKKFYKHFVLGEKKEEEYSKALTIGSVVHCLLLEPQEFDNKFLLATCETPPGGMLLTFVESLYKHSVVNMNEDGSIKANFSDLVQTAYEESGYKIKLEAVLGKFEKEGKEYFDQLMAAKQEGKTIVCMDDINIASKIVEMVKGDEFVGEYFRDIDHCELKVEGFMVDGVEMKGMLDRLIIDHEHETIQLMDLKVVFDNQNFRREYYLKRQAYIQAYIYQEAIKSGKLDLGFDYSKYLVLSPIFLAIDSGCFYAPIRYDVGLKGLEMAYNGFVENGREYPGVKSTLEEIKWCQETGNWRISKKAYDNKGILNLE